MVKYLVNAFSLGMLKLPKQYQKWYHLCITPLHYAEVCREVKSNKIVNAIGHRGTVDLINNLCGTSFNVNRISITLEPEDELLLVQITERLDEGRVLSFNEIMEMLREDKVKFYRVYYTDRYF